jgi:hypothetical protein
VEIAHRLQHRVLINLVITVGRLCSRRLREDALKDLEHSHAILILTGTQALEALLPLVFVFLVIPMLGLPSNLEVFLERLTPVLVIIFVGISTIRTLSLVEAKITHRAKAKYGGEERQIRAAETRYSVCASDAQSVSGFGNARCGIDGV